MLVFSKSKIKASKDRTEQTPNYLRADGRQPAPGLLQRAAGGAGGAGAWGGGGVRDLGARAQGSDHQAIWLVSAQEDGGMSGKQGANVLTMIIYLFP